MIRVGLVEKLRYRLGLLPVFLMNTGSIFFKQWKNIVF